LWRRPPATASTPMRRTASTRSPKLVRAGIADRERPTFINARTIPVGV
jgi:hypothetical protein